MRIHLIAIGGSAMHNMAIALHKKGYHITGSDDEIMEPSKSRLEKQGILPKQIGWYPENITEDVDAVILGMHARADNPELIKAQQLGLKIYSYPEYIYEQTKDKIRVVVGGSHGKTTITSILLHVLNKTGIDCDYLVGAQLEGFDTMVKLTAEAKIAVIEGDEYLASPIDRRPKFHLYKPNIAILSGIAWDHINVFPVYEDYVEQFRIFMRMIEPGGALIYCKNDKEVVRAVESTEMSIEKIPYGIPEHSIKNGITFLNGNKLNVFGDHNLMNIEGARLVCKKLGITDAQFYLAITSFKGASKRLEVVAKTDKRIIYRDFAHSPSKLKATIEAVKKQYPEKLLAACFELHTFSSLNENFLNEYRESMKDAAYSFVYFNPKVIAHKKLKPITVEQVGKAFGGEEWLLKGMVVFTEQKDLLDALYHLKDKNANILLMSSGNFDGMDIKQLVESLG